MANISLNTFLSFQTDTVNLGIRLCDIIQEDGSLPPYTHMPRVQVSSRCQIKMYEGRNEEQSGRKEAGDFSHGKIPPRIIKN